MSIFRRVLTENFRIMLKKRTKASKKPKISYKFEKPEDREVFRVLLRCIRESNNKCIMNDKCIMNGRFDKHKLIRACYVSRHNHTGENFQTNIQYWLGDSGMQYDGFDSMMYIVRLINALGSKYKELVSTLNIRLSSYESEKSSPAVGTVYNDPVACKHEIEEAVKKAGLSFSNEKIQAIISRANGITNHIPF